MRRQRILEGNRAGENAAVKLRQHHMHRQIGSAETARRLSHHAARRVVALMTCRTGTSAPSSALSPSALPAANAVMVTITAGSSRANAPRKNSAAAASFKLVTNERRRRETARRERLAQRVDRRGIGRKQHGAIEDDRDGLARPAAKPLADRDRRRLRRGR